MAKQKKITRKQLLKEPDEFITFTGKLIRFARAHRNAIIAVAGAFFLLVVSGSGYRYFSNRAEDRSFALLDQGLAKYRQSMTQNDPVKALADVKENFELILDKYSGKSGGQVARVAYANICYQAGDTETAAKLYERALKDFADNPPMKGRILSGLGYCHEARSDYTSAVRYFAQASTAPGALMKDEALFNLGRIYDRLGEFSLSLKAFKQITTEHATSMYAGLAAERIAGQGT